MFSTHVVGGEIFYTYLGNNNYEITLKVYRDCGPTNTQGTGFDAPAALGVFMTSNGTMVNGNFSMSLSSAVVSFVPIELENPCFILPPDVCVERAVYVESIYLPPIAGGYTLVYARCCRNPSIDNLISPQTQGATFTSHIPGTELSGQNSAARFTNFPPVALCLNAEFYFDHSATDPDSDSLSYEFCAPLLGGTAANPAPDPPQGPPFQSLNYAAGFSSSYPIASNPAFVINANTGYITGFATELGQYVIGICVSEYRDGLLINTTNRDFQFNVTMCDPNIVATIPSQTDFCTGLTLQFSNQSTNATSFHWDFGVAGIDSDTSHISSPEFTYSSSGVYNVMLIANPGWPCADTAITTFTSLPVISPQIVVGQYECMNNLDTYDFSMTGTVSPNATYAWNFGADSQPTSSSLANPSNIIMNSEALQMNVTLSVQDNGCVEADTTALNNPADPVSGITPQTTFCDGFQFPFQNTAENAISYLWDFGLPGNADISLLPDPIHTYADTGVYLVSLIVSAPLSCSDTSYSTAAIYGLLQASFPDVPIGCLGESSYNFSAVGATTNEAVYSWDFGIATSPPFSNQQNPLNVLFTQIGVHPVTLTISENGCVKTYSDSVSIVDHFITNLSVNSSDGCPGLVVQMIGSAVSDVPVYYLWDFGDGITSQQGETTHTYESPGIYDVTVTAFTLQGCVDSLTQVFHGAVVVHPDPTPGFTITPQIVDILYPEVMIADSSLGAVECHFTMSDGGTSDDCDFAYNWTEAGIQTITQHVTSEFGCTARVTGTVIINGFVFYAPNTFTPNFDGTNDFWFPKMTGISKYHIKIFNRWGDPIFESDDPLKPWNGNVHNSEFLAQNGVYNYVVLAEDLVGLPHAFNGHITLFR